MAQQTWLRIEGVLTHGGWQYVSKWGCEARRIPAEFAAQVAKQAPAQVEAVLLDATGGVIARGMPRLAQSVCRTGSATARTRLAAYLPLLARAASYEIRNAGVTLHRAMIPPAVPSVRVSSCVYEGDSVQVRWEAESREPGDLRFSVACVLGARTFPLALFTTERSLSANLAGVPGPGEACISVLASDGVRSAAAMSEKFEVPARPAILTVISPRDQSSYGYHEPIALTAAATDRGGRTVPDGGIQWLCDGKVVALDQRAAILTNASAGDHRITLIAGGSEASVAITVREQTDSEREWVGIFEVPDRNATP